jgi:hypothetical protein
MVARSQFGDNVFRLAEKFRGDAEANSMRASSPESGITIGRFPQARNAEHLHHVQREMVARPQSPDKEFRLDEEFGGDAAAYQLAILVGELEDAARAGYMELPPGGKMYRPTWKGAFLMAWKQMWPAKGLLRAVRDVRAARLLMELEDDRLKRA